MKIFAIRVSQPLGEFYISSVPAAALAGRVRNRPRSSQTANEDIQRLFSEKRIAEITNFSKDPQATFPTPIILAVESSEVKEIYLDLQKVEQSAPPQKNGPAKINSELRCFEIPDEGEFADVLDGQHRILGLQNSSAIGEFDLPVVFMFDLSTDDKAFVFSIINSKQTPVSGSLIYDLFDLSKFRSPQKTCHYLAQSLNNKENGPFYRRIKMLGRKEEHHEKRVMLSQGSFAARLQDLISKDPMEDARILKSPHETLKEDLRCPLRKYFIAKQDDTILKILTNYFEAIAETFDKEWGDETGVYIIRKTVGYTALIIVLRHILEEGFAAKNLTKDFFKQKAKQFKASLNDKLLTSDNFPTNSAGAVILAKTLLNMDQLIYKVTEAPDIENLTLDM